MEEPTIFIGCNHPDLPEHLRPEIQKYIDALEEKNQQIEALRQIGERFPSHLMAMALVCASEHLEIFVPGTQALTWRLRCAVEAHTRMKTMSLQELTDYIENHYPPNL